jgi:hypothetical protein
LPEVVIGVAPLICRDEIVEMARTFGPVARPQQPFRLVIAGSRAAARNFQKPEFLRQKLSLQTVILLGATANLLAHKKAPAKTGAMTSQIKRGLAERNRRDHDQHHDGDQHRLR